MTFSSDQITQSFQDLEFDSDFLKSLLETDFLQIENDFSLFNSTETKDVTTNEFSFNATETKDVTKKNLKEKINKFSKEKNKEATKRYRLKKSKERLKLFAELDFYENLNKELKVKIEEIKLEIKVLKSLFIQINLEKKIF